MVANFMLSHPGIPLVDKNALLARQIERAQRVAREARQFLDDQEKRLERLRA